MSLLKHFKHRKIIFKSINIITSFLKRIGLVNWQFSYQPAALESAEDSFKGVETQGLGTSEGPILPMLDQLQGIRVNEQLI